MAIQLLGLHYHISAWNRSEILLLKPSVVFATSVLCCWCIAWKYHHVVLTTREHMFASFWGPVSPTKCQELKSRCSQSVLIRTFFPGYLSQIDFLLLLLSHSLLTNCARPGSKTKTHNFLVTWTVSPFFILQAGNHYSHSDKSTKVGSPQKSSQIPCGTPAAWKTGI